MKDRARVGLGSRTGRNRADDRTREHRPLTGLKRSPKRYGLVLASGFDDANMDNGTGWTMRDTEKTGAGLLTRRGCLCSRGGAAGAAILPGTPANAADWPTRQVTVIVP